MKTFEKQTAAEVIKLLECIDSIYTGLLDYGSLKLMSKDLKGSDTVDYGFQIKSKTTKSTDNVFVGIWFEYWEDSGFPMIITLDTLTPSFDKVNIEMKRIQNQNPNLFDLFQVYNDWPILVLSANAIFNEEHHPQLVQIIYNLSKFAGI